MAHVPASPSPPGGARSLTPMPIGIRLGPEPGAVRRAGFTQTFSIEPKFRAIRGIRTRETPCPPQPDRLRRDASAAPTTGDES